MGWLGATVLGGIGAVVGGPIGAAIGASIGGMMDGGEEAEWQETPVWREEPALREDNLPDYNDDLEDYDESGLIFITTLFSMLGKMAKADGVVDESEINVVSEFLNKLELDYDMIDYAQRAFNNSIKDDYSIYDYANQYSELIEDEEMRIMVYQILIRITLADGIIDDREDEILRKITYNLRINNSLYTAFANEFKNNNETKEKNDLEIFYKLLQSTPKNTDAEIKKKYRQLVAEYHPDKIQSKGLPDGFIVFATEHVKKLNEAYEIIMKSRR